MNLKFETIADNAITLQIEKEDYSVADILHKELLNVKHVKFAGVPPPHPLIKTLTVQVHTDGSKPAKALLEAIDLSQKRVSELISVANSVFPSTDRRSTSSSGLATDETISSTQSS